MLTCYLQVIEHRVYDNCTHVGFKEVCAVTMSGKTHKEVFSGRLWRMGLGDQD